MAKTGRTLKLRDYHSARPAVRSAFVREMFNVVAPTYDFLTRMLSFGRDGAWKRLLVRGLPERKRPRVLDLACGTGDLTLALARKYPFGTVTGLDWNAAMLARAASRRMPGNVSFVRRDMSRTRFRSAGFDLVTGGYALRNAPDLAAMLKEIHRLLKPGGVGAFLDFSKSPGRFAQAVSLFALRVWGGLWGVLLHGNPDIYAYIAESLQRFPDREALKRLVRETGFKRLSSMVLFFGFVEINFFEK